METPIDDALFADLPSKKYTVIYADPPWQYDDPANAGHRGAKWKYPVVGHEDIARLPVQDIADDDAALFMWATYPKIKEALEVMGAWGFTYKTVAFTWVKRNKISDSLFWGMGRWTRANAEVVLLGTRGKPRRVDAGVHQVIEAPVQGHSVKPDEARQRIVRLLGDVPRIELFARQAPAGWDVWGNQAPEGQND